MIETFAIKWLESVIIFCIDSSMHYTVHKCTVYTSSKGNKNLQYGSQAPSFCKVAAAFAWGTVLWAHIAKGFMF